MTTYVIGDVHGCYDELQLLLQKINFDIQKDRLIFTGDTINKGPKSLETINFIMSLGDSAQVTLGNHEILFLAVSYNYLPSNNKNNFNDIIKAKKLKEIQDWLCNQNLLIRINDIFITHAGIPHIWSPKKAMKMAKEVEFVLKNQTTRRLLLANLFNNEGDKWDKELEGIERWLCILNYFTQMRTIDKNGRLNLKFSSTIDQIPENFKPWFKLKHKKFTDNYKIIFGHWAAIKGETKDSNVIALDTGCVFGGKLSCYCIETDKKYAVKALKSSIRIFRYMDILVINGPNLNLLGTRQPKFYGHKTLADINSDLLETAKKNNISINFYQSNHEGEIVDKIQQTAAKIIIINPAAYTYTSVAIRDAFLAINKPFIEIHLSNIYNREEFRTKSLLSDIAYGCIFGFGPNGYILALIEAINYINMKGE